MGSSEEINKVPLGSYERGESEVEVALVDEVPCLYVM